MRKLNGTDVFSLVRLIKASGVREQLKKIIDDIAKNGTENLNTEELGINAMITIFDALAERKMEQAIWDFLAPIMEMTADEVSQLDLKSLFGAINSIAEENDLKNFFSYVSSILGKKSLT